MKVLTCKKFHPKTFLPLTEAVRGQLYKIANSPNALPGPS